ncbi:MAG: hypothetical protein R6U68_07255 [Desulfobacteraceae bacterium]
MKYIFYIFGILIVLTFIVFYRTSDFEVNLSKPAIIINDRIVSEKEFNGMLEARAPTSHMGDIVNSIITNELLIQEALKEKINKEEDFRRSVESFYEQSLVKILIDRKFNSLDPKVSDRMVQQCIDMSGKEIEFNQCLYKDRKSIQHNKFISCILKKMPFQQLSAELQYIVFNLKQGQTSLPVETEQGLVTYTLTGIFNGSESEPALNENEAREFLVHQKKSGMFNTWLENLEKNADIKVLIRDAQVF